MVNTGGGLLGDTLNVLEEFRELCEGDETKSDQSCILQLYQAISQLTLVHHSGKVTTIVEDHVGLSTVGEGLDRLLNAP